MAVDASKLLKRRKGLGSPPIEGTPEIERLAGRSAGSEFALTTPPSPTPELQSRTAARHEGLTGGVRERQTTLGVEAAHSEAGPVPQDRTGLAPVRLGAAHSEQDGSEESSASTPRKRVPLPQAETRVPFTTRVTLSTKERLEDACYHLRRKHQDFINEAILRHLEKHGF